MDGRDHKILYAIDVLINILTKKIIEKISFTFKSFFYTFIILHVYVRECQNI